MCYAWLSTYLYLFLTPNISESRIIKVHFQAIKKIVIIKKPLTTCPERENKNQGSLWGL